MFVRFDLKAFTVYGFNNYFYFRVYTYKNRYTKAQKALKQRIYTNMYNQNTENLNISPTQISEKRQFGIDFSLIINMYKAGSKSLTH